MGIDVPIGNQVINLEVTQNGQQYTELGHSFLYNMVDPSLTEEDLKKLDEEEAKT